MSNRFEMDLKDDISHFSSFGKMPDGSICRTFGSESYREAANALCSYMTSLGLNSYMDSVGNVHGILHGNQSDGQKELLIGSHLDTVKEGGCFDGLLGIAAGVACCRRIMEDGIQLKHDLHIIATNGEEGNELGGTFGSRCLTGQFDLSDPAISDLLGKYNLTTEDIKNAEMDFGKAVGWLELHIEQGCTLEKEEDEIGIVTGIVGLQRFEIEISGESNHAGTTMMEYRRDAVVKCAEIIQFGDQLARELSNDFVCTFSNFEIHPNTTAVINNRVKMLLEFRNRDSELMNTFISLLRQKFENDEQFRVRFEKKVDKKPVDCEKNFIDSIESVCRSEHIRYRRMPSGATHDGNMMALRIPIGMIFVPSKNGISHSKYEWTDWKQCALGTDILYKTILQLEESS